MAEEAEYLSDGTQIHEETDSGDFFVAGQQVNEVIAEEGPPPTFNAAWYESAQLQPLGMGQ